MISVFKKGTPKIVGGFGEGTRSNPWYWYGKTSGQTVAVNNSNASSGDRYRVYLRVKLKGGTAYTIGQTAVGGGDGMIWLYNSGMSEVASDDHSYGEIAGLEVQDVMRYTPSADGVYIIGAGAYDSDTGDFTVAMSPAPEQETLPEVEYQYPTSSGFNSVGRPLKYRSAKEAGCAASRIPEEGLVFYAPFDKAANAAATGQKLTEAGSGDISYRTADGIPWVYFDGHSGYTTPAIDVSTFPDGFTASAFIKMERNGTLLSRRNATWHCQYSLDPYGFWSASTDGVEYRVTMAGATNLTNYVAHVAWRYHDYTVDWFLDGKMYQSGGVYLGYQDSGETKIGISYYDSIGESYKGYLAALRIYNRALSDNEIKALSKEFKV